MPGRQLTPTSYVVLGLVQILDRCTAYDMKQLSQQSIGMFWSFPHSQLYAEPARLVEDGLLHEEREEGGRRRRMYEITEAGCVALDAWLCDFSEARPGELRDPGLLKLFFSDGLSGEQMASLARTRRTVHEDRVTYLTELQREFGPVATARQLATLDMGMRWEATAAEFWDEIAQRPPA